MGRGIVEVGKGRTERYQLEVRTTDPNSTQNGEMWIRSDVAPDTDQIGTLRVDNGSGTWDVPIYDDAASVSNVEKLLRVPIGGTTGFIPVTTEGGTFPQLRMQHGGSLHEFHDDTEASAIPDSGVLHVRASDLGLSDGDPVTTWTDKSSGGHDLSSSGTVTYQESNSAFGGEPTVDISGSGYLENTAIPSLSQPFQIIMVASVTNPNNSNQQAMWDGHDSLEYQNRHNSNGDFDVWSSSGGLVSAGFGDSNPHLHNVLLDSGSVVYRIDSSQEADSTIGTTADFSDPLRLGTNAQASQSVPMEVAELIVYDRTLTNDEESTVESKLSSRYSL